MAMAVAGGHHLPTNHEKRRRRTYQQGLAGGAGDGVAKLGYAMAWRISTIPRRGASGHLPHEPSCENEQAWRRMKRWRTSWWRTARRRSTARRSRASPWRLVGGIVGAKKRIWGRMRIFSAFSPPNPHKIGHQSRF